MGIAVNFKVEIEEGKLKESARIDLTFLSSYEICEIFKIKPIFLQRYLNGFNNYNKQLNAVDQNDNRGSFKVMGLSCY